MPTTTVLYISHSSRLYGAERCLLELIEGLSHKEYRPIVVVPRPGSLSERLNALDVSVIYCPLIKPWLTKVQEVRGYKRFLYSLYQISYLVRTVPVLKNIVRQYQVSLIYTLTSVIFDGALVAKLTRLPHVWHIHEMIGKDLRFCLGADVARRLIYHFSDRIITPSKTISQAYSNIPDVAKKIRVIHNGVDVSLFNQDINISDLQDRLGIPGTSKVIGMVAHMVPLKRHKDFLMAATKVKQLSPNSFFLIVGSDQNTSQYEQKIKSLSQELKLTKHIRWLEFREKVHEIFQIFDLLVIPSEEEAFGRVAIEAMAARKPVVATNVGGLPEIVVDGETGFLVPPRSPQELAQAILHILNDPQLAAAMGQAGRQRVEQYFSLTQYVDGVEAVYKELLNSVDDK